MTAAFEISPNCPESVAFRVDTNAVAGEVSGAVTTSGLKEVGEASGAVKTSGLKEVGEGRGPAGFSGVAEHGGWTGAR